jgi:hypothetical protein
MGSQVGICWSLFIRLGPLNLEKRVVEDMLGLHVRTSVFESFQCESVNTNVRSVDDSMFPTMCMN